MAILSSCKTTDGFSVHHRRYNSGYYVEHTSSPKSSNFKHNRPIEFKKDADLLIPIYGSNMESVASNTVVGREETIITHHLTDRNRRGSFSKGQSPLFITRICQKTNHLTFFSNRQELLKTMNSKKRAGTFGSVIAYVLMYAAVICVIAGIGLLAAGLGTSPILVIWGILLIVLGIALASAAAMAASGFSM